MRRVAHAASIRGNHRLTPRFVRTLTAAALALALAACANGPKGVRITNNGQSATTDKTPVPITDFTADQIRAAIVGKTFQYTRPDGNGFSLIERIKVAWSPRGKSVRPIEPWNSTSPTRAKRFSSLKNTTDPGVCPGAS